MSDKTLSVNYAAYGRNGVWVTVDFAGRIFQSINGTTWIQTALSPSILTGIAYGQSKFLAMGDDGSYLLSSDGKTWTAKHSVDLIPQVTGGVAFGGGVFAAMAENASTVYTSYDGLIWNKRVLIPGVAWDGVGSPAHFTSMRGICYWCLKFGAGTFFAPRRLIIFCSGTGPVRITANDCGICWY